MTFDEKVNELSSITKLLESIDIPARVFDEKVPEPVVMMFLNTDDETVWNGDEDPEDPHAATLAFYDMYSGDDEDEDDVTLDSKYLIFYADVIVDCDDLEELSILRVINEVNSEIEIGHFYFAKEVADESPRVHFKYILGTEETEEFSESVIGETVIMMGVYYDIMKEKLLELKG